MEPAKRCVVLTDKEHSDPACSTEFMAARCYIVADFPKFRAVAFTDPLGSITVVADFCRTTDFSDPTPIVFDTSFVIGRHHRDQAKTLRGERFLNSFGRRLDLDYLLLPQDTEGSITNARMLGVPDQNRYRRIPKLMKNRVICFCRARHKNEPIRRVLQASRRRYHVPIQIFCGLPPLPDRDLRGCATKPPERLSKPEKQPVLGARWRWYQNNPSSIK